MNTDNHKANICSKLTLCHMLLSLEIDESETYLFAHICFFHLTEVVSEVIIYTGFIRHIMHDVFYIYLFIDLLKVRLVVP